MAGTSLTSVSLGQDLAAVLLRTVVMVAVIAVVVYERLRLALLRKAWLNQNLIWGLAVVTAGGLTLLLA